MLLLVMLIFILVLGIFFRLYFDQLFIISVFVSCYGSRGPFCRLFLRCKVDEGFSDKYEVWGLKFLKLVSLYCGPLLRSKVKTLYRGEVWLGEIVFGP